ncbi:DUF4363 family protein [Aminipila luticellarii]|uniref:DUF4363 family protein n=1 Tax=Aminipila luticellarii TaxID=2507160 RepID=A0A410PUH2_9FIRM|nr:DUF4363 family protein [Aminipila luticellarii]QAT42528.1 DUF4363 family protein [Aminipila luticellarii]
MRSFLISLSCLLLLVGSCLLYTNYSDNKIHEFTDTIEQDILADVEDGNWEQAKDRFNKFEDDWHDYKKIACFFFSTDKLNAADYSIARAKYYIICEDDSNSSGELSCLKEQLKFLHDNETFSLSNLF